MFNADWMTVVGTIGGGLAAVVVGQVVAERIGLTRVVRPAPTEIDRRRLVEGVVAWASAGSRASPADLMNLCLPPRRNSPLLGWLSPLVVVSALGLMGMALIGAEAPPAWALGVGFAGLMAGMLGIAASSAHEVVPIATEEANFRMAVVQSALESVWRRESPDRLEAALRSLMGTPPSAQESVPGAIPIQADADRGTSAGRRAA
ncbi:MAG: hypothetical protein FJ255_04620 [Phycisphaerae bacterium]|nr:hypothetical protein [Phycisphaerae bacterium]